ncbi:cyclase family protein [Kutzneria sp. NPDC052558]|uniref:cyclase family protein n=1 Tax=Kutzneria sp. NPDC052558 TaxID=3364121 RepID=UPI0037C59C49
MQLIDLSSPVDASFWEPEPLSITTMSAADGARHLASEMREHFGMDFDPAVLPGAEFLTNDTLSLTTHTGTHVDAPAHYGSITTYGEAPKTVEQLPVDWFYRPAVVLDLTDAPVGAVGADVLRAKLDEVGYTLSPLDIVLLNTGAARLVGTSKYFTEFVGLDRSGVDLLLDQGVRVIGTDAFSLDAPFTHIIEQYQKTGDPGVLWPAHFAGRDREFCQIERLANLDALPRAHGFTLSCFPVKIVGAGAGWARAVAVLD